MKDQKKYVLDKLHKHYQEYKDLWDDLLIKCFLGLCIDMAISDSELLQAEHSFINDLAFNFGYELSPNDELVIRKTWASYYLPKNLNEKQRRKLQGIFLKINDEQKKVIYEIIVYLITINEQIDDRELKLFAFFAYNFLGDDPNDFLDNIERFDLRSDDPATMRMMQGVYDEIRSPSVKDYNVEQKNRQKSIPMHSFKIHFMFAFEYRKILEQNDAVADYDLMYKSIFGESTTEYVDLPLKVLQEAEDPEAIKKVFKRIKGLFGDVGRLLHQKGVDFPEFQRAVIEWPRLRGFLSTKDWGEIRRLVHEEHAVTIETDPLDEEFLRNLTPSVANFFSNESSDWEDETTLSRKKIRSLFTDLLEKNNATLTDKNIKKNNKLSHIKFTDFFYHIFPPLGNERNQIGFFGFSIYYEDNLDEFLSFFAFQRFLYNATQDVKNLINIDYSKYYSADGVHIGYNERKPKFMVEVPNNRFVCSSEIETLSFSLHDLIRYFLASIPGEVFLRKNMKKMNEPIAIVNGVLASQHPEILDSVEIQGGYQILRTIDSPNKAEFDDNYLSEIMQKYSIQQVRTNMIAFSNRSLVSLGVSGDRFVLQSMFGASINKHARLLTLVAFQRINLLHFRREFMDYSKKLSEPVPFLQRYKRKKVLLNQLQNLREKQMAFNAEYNITEASYNYWLQKLYSRLRTSFNIDELLEALEGSLRDMADYSQRYKDAQIENIVRFSSATLIPAILIEPIISGGEAIHNIWTNIPIGAAYVLSIIGIAAACGFFYFLLFVGRNMLPMGVKKKELWHRRQRKKSKSEDTID